VQAEGSERPAQSAEAQNQTITIPAGTRIPLRLVSQITAKARRGDVIRATTAFPVTVGTQMAIPVGSYVEGTIEKLNKRAPSVELQFARIVYPNGYTVAIRGANAEAQVSGRGARIPSPTERSAASDQSATWVADDVDAWTQPPGHGPYVPDGAFAAGASDPPVPLPQQTEPPPLPKPPSHVGLFVGVALGSAAAVIVAALLGRRQYTATGVVFDTGWQFDMVLQNPVTVDAASIGAAQAAPSGQ
jgi:hypothetical protein